MEMAGYGKISATANMVSISGAKINLLNPKQSKNTTNKVKSSKESHAYGVYNVVVPADLEGDSNMSERKIFIPTYINKLRVVGCLDSGSDLTILHVSLYNKITPPKHCLEQSDITYITTFSDNNISVIGKFTCHLRLNLEHPGIQISIYVIPDTERG